MWYCVSPESEFLSWIPGPGSEERGVDCPSFPLCYSDTGLPLPAPPSSPQTHSPPLGIRATYTTALRGTNSVTYQRQTHTSIRSWKSEFGDITLMEEVGVFGATEAVI